MAFFIPALRRLRTSALDDDDGLGILHVGSGRAALLAVGGDLLHLHALPDVLGEVGAGSLGLLDEGAQELLRALDDLLPLGDADVLDSEDLDGCLAGSDTVDGLEGGGEYYSLHLVEAAGHVDDPLGLPSLGDDVHLYPSDPSGFLQVPQVEVVSEKSFRLAEDRSDDVGLVDDPVGVDLGLHHVFCCVRVNAVQ